MARTPKLRKDGRIDRRCFNGPPVRIKLRPCQHCGEVFKPRTEKMVYCKNECRLAALHESRRKAGRFFGVECWTQKEDAVLRRLYPDPRNTLKLIQLKLPGRTLRAILHRRHALGLRRVYGDESEPASGRWSEARKRHKSREMTGDGNPFYGRKLSRITRAKISAALKGTSAFHRLNKDPEFQKKRRRAWHGAVQACPNKKERLLGRILERVCPGEYKFVGDGSFIVDGLNPDFVNVNGQKKVIELFGRTFHHTKHCPWKVQKRQTAKGRRAALAKFGYSMLLIWDDELRRGNRKKLIAKIRDFV